ncbi:MAG: hypothetical protein LBK24_01885 [Puniceicoccales bacterium]|jgi:hypothetical protein|nr:hypothetical protein [Puniceicoccales bacterium]
MNFWKEMAMDAGKWCIVRLGDDYNWWVHEASDDTFCDTELGILDPKQIEHMTDLLDQLKQYGLDDEVVNGAFIPYVIDREMAKEMLRLYEVKDNILSPRERIFCLPNSSGEQEGMFAEFIDHIMALRIKLLNASFDFKQPLNLEEVEDILHAEQQERYIAGIRTHAFDEIMSILDYVPAGYSLDADIEDEDEDKEDIDLLEFDDDVEESLKIEGDNPGDW